MSTVFPWGVCQGGSRLQVSTAGLEGRRTKQGPHLEENKDICATELVLSDTSHLNLLKHKPITFPCPKPREVK